MFTIIWIIAWALIFGIFDDPSTSQVVWFIIVGVVTPIVVWLKRQRHFIMISYETLPYIYFNEKRKNNSKYLKMQTFLFDIFNRYKRFSENLDVKTVLCNKTWFVFNNSGEREIYIFQENGKLKISLNGKVTHATWEYIPANKSLIISGNEQSYMVHAAYVDNILFALQ